MSVQLGPSRSLSARDWQAVLPKSWDFLLPHSWEYDYESALVALADSE